MLLDTGDALVGGGFLGDATQGKVVVAGMNLMDYDAMALGPLELSLGVEKLHARMEEARFPVLSANVQDAASGELFAEPYVILGIEGYRIAVIGLTRVPEQPVPGFSVEDPLRAAEQVVPEAASQADTVILLTNLGYRAAKDLVGTVPGIDLSISALPAQLPRDVSRARGTGTLVVTAEQPLKRHSGRRVGQLRLSTDSEGAWSVSDWESVPMGNDLVDDPQMRLMLDSYWSKHRGD